MIGLVLSNLSVKDPEVKVKVVHSPFVIRLNITAKVVTPKIGKELQYNIDMKELIKSLNAGEITLEQFVAIILETSVTNN